MCLLSFHFALARPIPNTHRMWLTVNPNTTVFSLSLLARPLRRLPISPALERRTTIVSNHVPYQTGANRSSSSERHWFSLHLITGPTLENCDLKRYTREAPGVCSNIRRSIFAFPAWVRYFNHNSIHPVSTGPHAAYTKRVIFRAPVVYGLYPVTIDFPTGLSVSKLRGHICFIGSLFEQCRVIHSRPHLVPQRRVIKVSILRYMTNCCHIGGSSRSGC